VYAQVVRVLIMIVWAVAAVGCSSHSQPVDATDRGACLAAFNAALQRACAGPADCVLAPHDDCCGTVQLGIRSGAQAAFTTAEAALHQCSPCQPSGCAHQEQAEDGRSATTAGQKIVAICAASRCTSVVQ
jgi:hypothetical protein